MRNRKILSTLSVSLALASSVTEAAVLYSVTDLGTLGGSYSYAASVNSAGQVTGSAATVDDAWNMPFSNNGTMSNLGSLRSMGLPGDGAGYGINSQGNIVGVSHVNNGDAHAFFYDGAMHDIGTSLGSLSVATGLNDHNVIVGSYFNGAGQRGFVYNGTIHDIGGLGGTMTIPMAINNNNIVVGWGSNSSNQDRAFIYDGSLYDIGSAISSSFSYAVDINDTGQIVGHYYAGDMKEVAFLYHNGAVTDLGTLGGIWSRAQSINATGQVVGYSTTSGMSGQSAFLYDGLMQNLNSLIDPDAGWNLQYAASISDTGYIVGNGMFQGSNRAFLLKPLSINAVPEPASWAMMIVGFGMIGGSFRKTVSRKSKAPALV